MKFLEYWYVSLNGGVQFVQIKLVFYLLYLSRLLLYLFKPTILVSFRSYIMNGVRFRVNVTRYLRLFCSLVELLCGSSRLVNGWTASLSGLKVLDSLL